MFGKRKKTVTKESLEKTIAREYQSGAVNFEDLAKKYKVTLEFVQAAVEGEAHAVQS